MKQQKTKTILITEETIESVRKEAYKELVNYMEWMVKNYPKVHEHYVITCHKCGKKFVNVIDSKTNKLIKYLWKPNCSCLGKDLRLSKG